MFYSEFLLDCMAELRKIATPTNIKVESILRSMLFTMPDRRMLEASIDIESWELTAEKKAILLEKKESIRFHHSLKELYLSPFSRYFETALCLKLLESPLPTMMAAIQKISSNILLVLNDYHHYLADTELALFLDRLSKQHFVPGRLSFKPTIADVILILTENKSSNFYHIMNIHLLFADICLRNLKSYPNWMHVPRVDSSVVGHVYQTKDAVCAFMNEYLYQSKMFDDRGRIFKVRDKYKAPVDTHLNQNNAFSSQQGIVLEYNEDLPLADHIWRQDRFYTDPDYASPYVMTTLTRGLPYVAGPSGLMTLLLPLAMLVGQLDSSDDLFYYILSCCVYMVSGGLHSFYETLMTAEDKLKVFSLNGVRFIVDGDWQQTVGEFLRLFHDDVNFSDVLENAYDDLLLYNARIKLRESLSLLNPNEFVLILSDDELFKLMQKLASVSFFL